MKKIFKDNMYTVFAALLLLTFFGYSFFQSDNLEKSYQSVVIKSGDTVWDLASDYCSTIEDQTAFVHWVEDNNHFDVSSVEPGQEIVIPVKKSGTDGLMLADSE